MNTKLDCAADGERAMDMQAKTQCLGLFYQIDFAAHFLELLQPELQSTSESTNSFHEESICLQWLLDLGCASDLITTDFYVNNFRCCAIVSVSKTHLVLLQSGCCT
jgi:hypothetical protein